MILESNKVFKIIETLFREVFINICNSNFYFYAFFFSHTVIPLCTLHLFNNVIEMH